MARSATTELLRPATGPVALLIGTRKGAFVLRGDRTRRTWNLSAHDVPRTHRASRDADSAWVFPMDGSTVWPRVSPGGETR